MSDIESLKQLLRDTAAALEPVSSTIDAPYPYWINGDDEGTSWCRPCGEEQIARLKAEQPDGEFDLAGGYEQQAEDSCCHCEGCGRLLDYRLTDTGVDQEISHFSQHVAETASADDVFHVVRLLEGAENSDDPAILDAAARIGITIAKSVKASALIA